MWREYYDEPWTWTDNLRDCMLQDCMEWVDYASGVPLGCSTCCIFLKKETAVAAAVVVAAASDVYVASVFAVISSALDTPVGKGVVNRWMTVGTVSASASILMIPWRTAKVLAVAVDELECRSAKSCWSRQEECNCWDCMALEVSQA